MKKINVGIVGCGNISGIYFENLCNVFNNIVDVVACSDLQIKRAKEKKEEFGIDKVCSTEELLADNNIDIVLNLTTPNSHADICIRALKANKHVYVEKPLAITREDGKAILKLAKEKSLLVGGAPDTFLGASIQTCKKIIDDGWIGKPIAATAYMVCHGHESWHPDPEFYYKVGGGPMFDMGPYYLTALIALLGPINKVTGITAKTFKTRTITSEKKFGKTIDVEIPTHINGIMSFDNGAIGNIITSFDVWDSHLPRIEIYGTEGTLSVPDPNRFSGEILLKRAGQQEWANMPYSSIYSENSRGIGVADMAYAIRENRINRANGELTYHVLDVMHAFHDSSNMDKHINIESTCLRPESLKNNIIKGML